MKSTLIFALVVMSFAAVSATCGEPPHEIVYPVTLDRIGEFIEDLGYSFERVTAESREGRTSEWFFLAIEGDNRSFDACVQLLESVDMIYMYISNYMALPLSDDATIPMLTYLMNENSKLTFGRFDWDMEYGELRYSHTLPVDDGISKETFQAYFSALINVADEKLPRLEGYLEKFGESGED